MLEHDRFRSPATPINVELRCPECARPFFVAERGPNTTVSVTACPHGDCQVVCFVQTETIRNRVLHKSVSVEALVQRPRLELELIMVLWLIALFVGAPIWMWLDAWSLDVKQWVLIVTLTTPALLLGVCGLFVTLIDAVDAVPRGRRAHAKLRHAVRRARWLEARERSD